MHCVLTDRLSAYAVLYLSPIEATAQVLGWNPAPPVKRSHPIEPKRQIGSQNCSPPTHLAHLGDVLVERDRIIANFVATKVGKKSLGVQGPDRDVPQSDRRSLFIQPLRFRPLSALLVASILRGIKYPFAETTNTFLCPADRRYPHLDNCRFRSPYPQSDKRSYTPSRLAGPLICFVRSRISVCLSLAT